MAVSLLLFTTPKTIRFLSNLSKSKSQFCAKQGCEDEAQLSHLIKLVSLVLKSAGFNLRKFRSNSVVDEQFLNDEDKLISELSNTTSTLGLVWSPKRDEFVFSIAFDKIDCPTKRTILSAVSKIFDPLGILSIFIIRAKLLLQRLWISDYGWDDIVSDELKKMWLHFVNAVTISNICVPRHVICKNAIQVELHMFSDASGFAHGACAYLRSIDRDGKIYSHLLCAKSRVNPLKKQTIPRLELCGGLLAANLGDKINKALTVSLTSCTYWMDSSIALSWILAPRDKKLEVFVSNRVEKIKTLTRNDQWRHVPTQENPADLISRGVDSYDDKTADFWFHGPKFLRQTVELWPSSSHIGNIVVDPLPEDEVVVLSNVDEKVSNKVIDFSKYSSLKRLIRIMALVLRFIDRCKNYNQQEENEQTNIEFIGLSVEEIAKGSNCLVKLAQYECFLKEWKLLKDKKQLNKNNNILSLSPFLDDEDIIRVGGRLVNSNFSYDRKHPILLSPRHRLSVLIFEEEHKKLMHAGPQLLLSSVRERYWVVNGRKLARSVYEKCILCRRIRGKTLEPIMGNLPSQRLTPGIPFECTGVDFAGPFYITDRKGRGCKISKCYLCIFVCFATKALHLEAVSDLSKDGFILCLKRFIARRGKPKTIFCDNGTNFVGASNELGSFIKSNSGDIAQFAVDEAIVFKFIPVYSPNFGGLWEAGVKSAKFHIKRVLGDRHLTFEELSTLFSQIEAILNSRPLCPLTSIPDDLTPLTPGHFLIGKPLTSIPSHDLTELKTHRLDRYLALEQMRQHFWQRWQLEYVSELQQKVKWKRQKYPELKIGDMVIIKEEGCPPLKWRIGRIDCIYPGSDGIGRVADVKTSNGVIRRAFSRLCPLLPSDDVEEPNPSSSIQ